VIPVRGVVLNPASGQPLGIEITNDQTLCARLYVGVCPVDQRGRVVTSVLNDPFKSKQYGLSPPSQSNEPHTPNTPPPPSSSSSSSSSSGGNPKRRPSLIQVVQETANGGLNNPPRSAYNSLLLPSDDVTDSMCKPKSREEAKRVWSKDGTEFKVTIGGDAAQWCFSPTPIPTSRMNSLNSNQHQRRSVVAIQSNRIYLTAVNFLLRLETNEPMFVPYPRHLIGEMGRHSMGTSYLEESGIIHEVVTSLFEEGKGEESKEEISNNNQSSDMNNKEPDDDDDDIEEEGRDTFDITSNEDEDSMSVYSSHLAKRKGAVWAIGHLFSSESGLKNKN